MMDEGAKREPDSRPPNEDQHERATDAGAGGGSAEAAGVPRDAAYWAKLVDHLSVGPLPEGATNINVDGRRVTSPLQGFGRLWLKTYRVAIPDPNISPAEIIEGWKQNFASFWPKGNNFYGPLTSLSPGDVAVLNLRTGGGVKLSTGVFVLYADDESFTFMTPEGHQFAAWITFSAYRDGAVGYAQVQALLRTGDPLFEIAWPIMKRMEDAFWRRTLANLASSFGVEDAQIEVVETCLDKHRQWRMVKNVKYNSAIRSGLYVISLPLRWLVDTVKKARSERESR